MPAVPVDLAATLAAERARLVGLCAHLTGDPQAAEDLAQETLLEAWRHADRLRDPTGAAPWLSAVARNVCLRWARRRSRDAARLAGPPPEDTPLAGLDLEAELERDELAGLLDRALALLPPATRAALVARYVEDAPQAQVALRLGLSEGAVAMRLQRGKLALRRLLATELCVEASAYGLGDGADGHWHDARLWCPACGRHRLQARLIRATGELTIRCPGCTPTAGASLSRAAMPLLHRDSPTAAAGVSRLLDWMHRSYYGIAAGGTVRCQRCDRPTPPLVIPAAWGQAPQLRYAVTTACAACGHRDRMWLSGIVLSLPEGRRFWRRHRRVRLLPEGTVEREGRAVAHIGLEALPSAARLEVLVEPPTLAVLRVVGGGG